MAVVVTPFAGCGAAAPPPLTPKSDDAITFVRVGVKRRGGRRLHVRCVLRCFACRPFVYTPSSHATGHHDVGRGDGGADGALVLVGGARGLLFQRPPPSQPCALSDPHAFRRRVVEPLVRYYGEVLKKQK